MIFPATSHDDAQIDALFASLKERWDSLDGLVHSIGFAPREAIAGDFLDGMTRENFRIAHDISAYSFPALAKAAHPMLTDSSSLLTLCYLGAERAIPNYNTMGLAKASLEASVRYLAASLGQQGRARERHFGRPDQDARGERHQGLRQDPGFRRRNAPLKRNVTIEQVGNVAAFLLSDLAGGVSAEIVHVDAGFHAVVGGMAGIGGVSACRVSRHGEERAVSLHVNGAFLSPGSSRTLPSMMSVRHVSITISVAVPCLSYPGHATLRPCPCP